MNKVTFLKSMPFSVCKSNFLNQLAHVKSLPQIKELHEFIENHNIVDISLANTIQQHHTVGLIINHQYCSLNELKDRIIAASGYANQYFYLAINKFYIYSTVDNPAAYSNNYDIPLINYCCKIIQNKFALLKHTIRDDDVGHLGNFLHPVTTLFFERYE